MQTETAPGEDRRDFLKKSCAVCLGGAVGALPALAGLAVYLDPLQRKADGNLLVRVTSLASLPEDGTPVLFPVITTRTDAWTKSVAPVGAVYVRRVTEQELQIFNVTCPHAGCAVEFQQEKDGFFCPCHNSLFTQEGKRTEDSPAARDLDTLKYEIRKGGEVWVQFQNFETGKAHKVAVS